MACDERFEQHFRNHSGKECKAIPRKSSREDSRKQHRLMGTEILFEFHGKKRLIEGVTRIEFQEERTVFHTSLGESISIQGALERATLREEGLVLQMNEPKKGSRLSEYSKSEEVLEVA